MNNKEGVSSENIAEEIADILRKNMENVLFFPIKKEKEDE